MKKIAYASGLILSLSLLSGCAYKTGCGVDDCVRHSTDTPCRAHANTCNNKCTTEVPTKPNCKKCQDSITNKQLKPVLPKKTPILKCNQRLRISVTGQGVAPCKGTCSPAQSYALAKRAAIADAYRLIAEKIKGVYVEGDDYIKNMAVKRTTVRTHVAACIRNANVVDTTFKDGLCEVEMDITLSYANFSH